MNCKRVVAVPVIVSVLGTRRMLLPDQLGVIQMTVYRAYVFDMVDASGFHARLIFWHTLVSCHSCRSLDLCAEDLQTGF